jgi:hypothetical protein
MPYSGYAWRTQNSEYSQEYSEYAWGYLAWNTTATSALKRLRDALLA